MDQKQRKGITVYDIVVIGLMAAMVFVCTMFLKIGPIPTPAGPTQIKTGNIVCLLSGLLFGGWRGGLAAGIGSALFDLSDPAFVESAPYTLVFFFAMGAVCGFISHAGQQGTSTRRDVIGAIAGSLSYLVLHIGKSILLLVLAGSSFPAAVAACSVKLITSGINAAVAVVASVLLAPVLRRALSRAGVRQKVLRKA